MQYTEDEIDLKKYALVLLNQWKLILLLGFLAALAGFGASRLQAKEYNATAGAMIIQIQYNLSISQDSSNVEQSQVPSYDPETIQAIAWSDMVVLSIFNQFEDELKPGISSYQGLKNSDLIRIKIRGNVLEITATARSPQLAAKLANAWLDEVVKVINQAYSGSEPLEEIQAQIPISRTKFDNAEERWQEFIQENSINLLEQETASLETVLQQLAESNGNRISRLVEHISKMEQLKLDAEALLSLQEQSGKSTPGTIGDALAVITLRNRILEDKGGQGIQFDIIDPANITGEAESFVGDIRQVITFAENEHASAEAALDDLLQSESMDANLADLNTRIQNLKAELQKELSIEEDLDNERDIAWFTYKALLEQEVELKASSETNQIIAPVFQAVEPVSHLSQNTIVNTLLGGIAGGIIAILWVLLREWWTSSETE